MTEEIHPAEAHAVQVLGYLRETLNVAVVEDDDAVLLEDRWGEMRRLDPRRSIEDHDVERAFDVERRLAAHEPDARIAGELALQHATKIVEPFDSGQAPDPRGQPFRRLAATEFEDIGAPQFRFDRSEKIDGRIGEHWHGIAATVDRPGPENAAQLPGFVHVVDRRREQLCHSPMPGPTVTLVLEALDGGCRLPNPHLFSSRSGARIHSPAATFFFLGRDGNRRPFFSRPAPNLTSGCVHRQAAALRRLVAAAKLPHPPQWRRRRRSAYNRRNRAAGGSWLPESRRSPSRASMSWTSTSRYISRRAASSG